jgi:hypothetical protein
MWCEFVQLGSTITLIEEEDTLIWLFNFSSILLFSISIQSN